MILPTPLAFRKEYISSMFSLIRKKNKYFFLGSIGRNRYGIYTRKNHQLMMKSLAYSLFCKLYIQGRVPVRNYFIYGKTSAFKDILYLKQMAPYRSTRSMFPLFVSRLKANERGMLHCLRENLILYY